jgi:hypothetical protein
MNKSLRKYAYVHRKEEIIENNNSNNNNNNVIIQSDKNAISHSDEQIPMIDSVVV